MTALHQSCDLRKLTKLAPSALMTYTPGLAEALEGEAYHNATYYRFTRSRRISAEQ